MHTTHEKRKVAITAQYIHFTLHTNLFLMILSDSFQSQNEYYYDLNIKVSNLDFGNHPSLFLLQGNLTVKCIII